MVCLARQHFQIARQMNSDGSRVVIAPSYWQQPLWFIFLRRAILAAPHFHLRRSHESVESYAHSCNVADCCVRSSARGHSRSVLVFAEPFGTEYSSARFRAAVRESSE